MIYGSPSPVPTPTLQSSGCNCLNVVAPTACKWDLYDLSETNPEHDFFDSTIVEYTDISGFPIEVKVLLTQDDKLFGEDANARLSESVRTRAVFTPSEETSILNMWGLSWNDTMQYLVIPRTTYTRDASLLYSITPELSGKPVQPKVGDIITTPFNERNYEITDIGSETAIFSAKKFVWELIVKPYRFSEQDATHREVYIGDPEDPFETLTQDPTGGIVPQNNYARDTYGDNEFVEEKSEQIDDYRDVVDPDRASFGY